MLKLLRIEFRKQASSSGFWILVALHSIVIVLISMNLNSFLKNANILINDIPDLDTSLKPILQFPDVWQNLTYIAGYFKIILALIVISSVSNEFTNNTARQNIIDGMSKKEWLYSKIGLAKILAFCATLLVLAIGFSLGFTQEIKVDMSTVFTGFEYVLAYFIELLVYFIYALFLVLVIKRTGISVILLLVYDLILEPIISWSLPDQISTFLPMSTIDNLNTFPFTKYVDIGNQAALSLEQLVWAVGYGIIFGILSFFVLKKKDL